MRKCEFLVTHTHIAADAPAGHQHPTEHQHPTGYQPPTRHQHPTGHQCPTGHQHPTTVPDISAPLDTSLLQYDYSEVTWVCQLWAVQGHVTHSPQVSWSQKAFWVDRTLKLQAAWHSMTTGNCQSPLVYRSHLGEAMFFKVLPSHAVWITVISSLLA